MQNTWQEQAERQHLGSRIHVHNEIFGQKSIPPQAGGPGWGLSTGPQSEARGATFESSFSDLHHHACSVGRLRPIVEAGLFGEFDLHRRAS